MIDHDIDSDLDPAVEALLRRTLGAVAAATPIDEFAVAPNGSPRRPVRPISIAAGLLIAVGLGAAYVTVTRGSTPAEPATSAPTGLQSSYHVLLDAPGWSMVRVDQQSTDRGEMTFSDGSRDVEMSWYPAADSDGALADWGDGAQRTEATVAGRAATLLSFGGTTSQRAIVEPTGGDTGLRIDGDLGSEADFRTMLDEVRQVPEADWLAAMPASAVRPADRPAVIDGMLAGVALPDGLDVGYLDDSPLVRDWYQLGVEVTSAVLCEWFDRYLAATEAGDGAAAQVAVDGLRTSDDWPVLHQMSSEGDWDMGVRQYVDDAADGTMVSDPGSKQFGRESLVSGLGCAF